MSAGRLFSIDGCLLTESLSFLANFLKEHCDKIRNVAQDAAAAYDELVEAYENVKDIFETVWEV